MLLQIQLEYWLPIIVNVGRYVIFAVIPFLIFYKLYPHKFTRQKIQSRVAVGKDFIRELRHSLQSVLVLIGIASVVRFSPFREHTLIYLDIHDYPLWWMPVSLIIAVIVQDAYFYWTHRFMHHKKVFKYFHVVHHQSTNPTPLASLSFNITETILEALLYPLLICILPMHIGVILLMTVLLMLFNAYGHLGYEIAPRWFRHSYLFEMLNTSVHHNLHHHKFKGNYGLYFRFWDRLMRTEHPDYVKEYDRVQAQRFGEGAVKVSLKHALLVMLLIIFGIGGSLMAQETIEGKWLSKEQGGIILIVEENGVYKGTLVEALDPDEERLIEGKEIVVMSGFKHTGDQAYCCGTLFQPRFNRYLEGTLTLIDPQTLVVEAKYGILSATRELERVE